MIKLLVVDDDADDRALIKLVIEECSDTVEVTELSDGIYVMDYLHSCPYDLLPNLIILDLNMPLMNGFEVLKAVRAEKKYDSVPIFVLTTGSGQREKAKAMELGAFNYLTKPPGYTEWVEKLCSLVDEKQGR